MLAKMSDRTNGSKAQQRDTLMWPMALLKQREC